MSKQILPLKGYTLVSIDQDYHGSTVLHAIKRDILGELPTVSSVSFDANFVKRQDIIDRRVYAQERGLSIVDFIRNDGRMGAIAEPDNYVEVCRLDSNTVGVGITKVRGNPTTYGPESSFIYSID